MAITNEIPTYGYGPNANQIATMGYYSSAVVPHTFGGEFGLTQIVDRTPGLGRIAERDIDWWIEHRA